MVVLLDTTLDHTGIANFLCIDYQAVHTTWKSTDVIHQAADFDNRVDSYLVYYYISIP